jgi:predicted DNA-binding protein
MASRRTQICLEDDLRERIDRVRARRGGTMADVVREADI